MRNKHDQWGSIARCPADYAAIGLARVNLLDQMKGGRYNPNQDVNGTWPARGAMATPTRGQCMHVVP